MTVLTPTKDTGATSKSNTVLYVEPELTVTDETLAADLAIEGVNAPFVADFLSACLTHERCGRHLYRSVATRTNNSALKAKYEEFGRETEHHVDVIEGLITAAGGNPDYVSPQARAVEATDSKLLESTFLAAGFLDLVVAEMAMVEAVFLAESVDHANWQALGQLAQQLPDGNIRQAFASAVEEVEAQEDDHLEWAHATRAQLTLLQATADQSGNVNGPVEDVITRIRSWFSGDTAEGSRGGGSSDLSELTKDELYAMAQDQNIEGRSDMTKDQLIAALGKG